jgi:DNA-binding MarR family transcriptional regulator
MSADMRAMTAQSDRIGRYFARQHDLISTDLRALLHIMVAETAGEPLTSSQLRQRIDVSPAAVTYLVDRMIDAGHLRRHAMELGREFFGPLGAHIRAALAEMPDSDLISAHQVMTAMIGAMSTFEDELSTPAREPGQRRRRTTATGRPRTVKR